MMIDAKTKLYGLLGNPVGHSLSPFLQNYFLQQAGINGVYLAFAVEGKEIGQVLAGLHGLGVGGCNVTIPHKEAVIPHLVGMSKAAEACGAVNTLIYSPEGYYGDNTDGAGLLAALEAKHQWHSRDKRILMIGAGGAAKGVAMAMAMAGAQDILLVNRTMKRAEQLAEQIRAYSAARVQVLPMEELSNGSLYQQVDTVVHTTSQGMYPHGDTMAPVAIEALGSEHLVVDLVYNPLETKLLRLAAQQGARTASGLGMFIYQGALAFKRWHGLWPQVENMEQILTAQLG